MDRLARRLPLPSRLPHALAPESRLWAVVLLVAPVLATGLTLILEPVDPDYWWHLATGNWILTHHRIPFTDPFSWTHGGQPWIAHEWLAELILALANRVAGYAGAILLTGMIAVAGFWLLLHGARCYGLSRRALALLTLLWGGIPLWALAVRPQVLGWAMLCLLLSELAAYATGRRHRLWALPLLFAVWVNINLTVLIGIGCLGLFALDRILHALPRPARTHTTSEAPAATAGPHQTEIAGSLPADQKPHLDLHLIVVTAACALALLVNPHGVGLLRFALKYADPNALRYHFIGEWQHPDIHDLTLLPFWLAAPLILPAAWTLVRRRALWPSALVLIFFAESLKAQRYTPIYGLVLFTFAGWLVWSRKERSSIPASVSDSGRTLGVFSGARPLLPRRGTLLLSLAATGAALALATRSGLSEFRWTPNPRNYPSAAANVLRTRYPRARLFNTYTWGGFLIERLYPVQRVYIDGREEMYGDAFLSHFLQLAAGDPSWQETFSQEGIDAALVERDAGIAAALRNAPGWSIAFEDDRSVLFIRSP
jgi:hypothetical protein